MFFLDYMTALVSVLLAVAFFTLLERKVMGLTHYRKGPTKVVAFGVSQPIADAMKLFTKEFYKLNLSKQTMFSMGPITSIFLMMMTWLWFEYSLMVVSSSMKILMLFATMGLVIYSFLLMSWGSNSTYALLGGHRAVSQTLSYEVCMLLVVLMLSYIWYSYNSSNLMAIQQGLWLSMAMPFMFFTWLLLCLAESNRTPFDTAEGESEIVSGFNIEYGGGSFAMIFISEYGSIIMLSFMTSMLFMSGYLMLIQILMIMFIFIWVRSSFPRVRYDQLMMMTWKSTLPLAISLMVLMMV